MAEKSKTFYIRVENNQVTDINTENNFNEEEEVAVREIKSKVIDGFVNGLFGLTTDHNESCGSKCGEGPLDEDEDDIYDHDSDVFDSDGESMSVLIAEGIKEHFAKNVKTMLMVPAVNRVEAASASAVSPDVTAAVPEAASAVSPDVTTLSLASLTNADSASPSPSHSPSSSSQENDRKVEDLIAEGVKNRFPEPQQISTADPAISGIISDELKRTFEKNTSELKPESPVILPDKNVKTQLSDLIKTELESIFGKNRRVRDIIGAKLKEKFERK